MYVDNSLSVKKTISDKARLFLQFILMFFSLILVFKLIGYIDLTLKKDSEPRTFTVKKSFINVTQDKDKFECLEASQFKNVEYFGKVGVFRQIISDITKIIISTSELSNGELSTKFKVTSKNYLFSGPPGTGKTQFVKSLVFKLNKNLMAYYKEEESKDLVGASFVSSNTIKAKYHGESEANIRMLFDEGRRNRYKATFIFIDEIDAFFSTRADTNYDYELSIKTEYLNLLSGISEDMRSNTFVIGASNRPDNIDPAFIRRLGTHIKFDLPDKTEIKVILDQITEKWGRDLESDSLLGECAEILANKNASQAFITDITSKLLFEYDECSVNLIKKLHKALLISIGENEPLSMTNLDLVNEELRDKFIFTKDL